MGLTYFNDFWCVNFEKIRHENLIGFGKDLQKKKVLSLE